MKPQRIIEKITFLYKLYRLKYMNWKFDQRLKAKDRKLNRAIKEADKLHKQTRYKYYVVNTSAGYKVLNNKMVKEAKKEKILPKRFDFLHLEKVAIYTTN